MDKELNIYIDIDDTIAERPPELRGEEGAYDYSKAVPIEDNIEKANQLYKNGHEITYWTARGAETGIDWESVTRDQLERWGCKYHHLVVGVPKPWDLVIDDTVLNVKDWSNLRIEKQFGYDK